MRQLLHIAAFWLTVVVAVRVAVCFPRSLLARILFWRLGPVPMRGESQADYLVRCARFSIGWFMQAAFLFVAGWGALRWDVSLFESLSFVVLWVVVIPLLGSVSLLVAFLAVARSFWLLRISRTHATSNSTHAAQA